MARSSSNNAAIKLGICVLLAAFLWWRSQITVDAVAAKCGQNVLSVENSPQGLIFRVEVWDQVVLPGSRPRSSFEYSCLRQADPGVISASLSSALQGITIEGMENPYFFSSGSNFYRGYLLKFPHLLLVVVVMILIQLLLETVRRRRPVPGLCQQCGYDIRGNSERCSECGTPISAGNTRREVPDASGKIMDRRLLLQLAFGVLVLHAAAAIIKTYIPYMGPTFSVLTNAITFLVPPPPGYILADGAWLNAMFLAIYAACMLATCLLWGVILACLIDIASHAAARLRGSKDEGHGHLRSLKNA